MPLDWEEGNAAQEPDETYNPFAPVDYAARLKAAPRRESERRAQLPPRPGQLYGTDRWLSPPKPLVPPAQAAQPAESDPWSGQFESNFFPAQPVSSPPPAAAPAIQLPPYLKRPALSHDAPRAESAAAPGRPAYQTFTPNSPAPEVRGEPAFSVSQTPASQPQEMEPSAPQASAADAARVRASEAAAAQPSTGREGARRRRRSERAQQAQATVEQASAVQAPAVQPFIEQAPVEQPFAVQSPAEEALPPTPEPPSCQPFPSYADDMGGDGEPAPEALAPDVGPADGFADEPFTQNAFPSEAQADFCAALGGATGEAFNPYVELAAPEEPPAAQAFFPPIGEPGSPYPAFFPMDPQPAREPEWPVQPTDEIAAFFASDIPANEPDLPAQMGALDAATPTAEPDGESASAAHALSWETEAQTSEEQKEEKEPSEREDPAWEAELPPLPKRPEPVWRDPFEPAAPKEEPYTPPPFSPPQQAGGRAPFASQTAEGPEGAEAAAPSHAAGSQTSARTPKPAASSKKAKAQKRAAPSKKPGAQKPASPKAAKAASAQQAAGPERPPIRVWRVAALISAAVMLVFCAIVGGRILLNLSQNEREMRAVKEDWQSRMGSDLRSGAARVELLPAGQTYEPTATPAPTAAIQTPTPTPIIPINEAAIQSLNKRDTSQVQEAPEATPTPPLRTKLTEYPGNPLRNEMDSLRALREESSEVVGRLVIDGVLDEVVVQRNNTFYLTHSYRGSSSTAGSVFVDESCSFRYPPENLLLRGQGGVEGKTFAPLWQYQTGGQAFVEAHSIISLTTLYEEARYVLFAVIVADSDPTSGGYFNYASHPTFPTDAEMLSYVESARAHSLYSFSVDVQASDRLLTLATVDTGGSSLVLLFRMARTDGR